MLPLLYPERDTAMTFAGPDDGLSFTERLKKMLDEGSAALGETKLADTVGRHAGMIASAARAVHPFTPVGIAESFGRNLAEHPDAFGEMHNAAEAAMRLYDNRVSHEMAREEAYDRRIKAVKDATGVTLQNPERLPVPTRELRPLSGDARLDPAAANRYQQFETRLAELRGSHPEQAAALSFGDINADAMEMSKGAESDYERVRHDTPLSWPASLAMQFSGGLWGIRRDPLMVGSFFVGPSGAVGRTVGARIASSALTQGLYNAGITAMEQPAVQAWRAELGLRSGAVPATENVGLAFLMGVIPGAALRALHEIPAMMRPAVKRVFDGVPEKGDIDTALASIRSALAEVDRAPPVGRAAATEMPARESAAIRLGEEMDDADRALLAPKPKDMPAEMHDDLTAAALRHGEDPLGQPAPEAVRYIEAYHGSPHDFDAFKLDKIGAGEGSQSFGHGLYFAEHPDVAKSYYALGDMRHADTVGGAPFDPGNPMHKAAAELSRSAGDRNAAATRLEAMGLPRDRQAAALLRADGPIPEFKSVRLGSASMYKVRINADKEHFLDWDKPLSEQPKAVQDFVKRLGLTETDLGEQAHVSGEKIYEALRNKLASGKKLPPDKNGMYRMDDGREAASAALSDAGIPGIKYLDQGSRSAGDGSRNYVVFDDKLVGIVEKNGKQIAPVSEEVAARLAEAQPRTRREAEMVASEALEEIGTRQSIVRTGENLARDRLPAPWKLTERADLIFPEGTSADGEAFRFPITDREGNEIGAIKFSIDSNSLISKTRTVNVEGSQITHENASSKGQGYGIEAYQKLVDFALASGRQFWSDRTVSPDAARMYEALKRRGYAVVKDDDPPWYGANYKVTGKLAPASSKDPLDKVPLARDDGTPTLVSARQVARAGERETQFAEIIRACK